MLMAAFQFELRVLAKCVKCSCPEPYSGGMRKHCCSDTSKLVPIHLALAKMYFLLLLLIGLINFCSGLFYGFSVSIPL